MKLFTDSGNFQALKVLISSKIAGVDVKQIEVKHAECVVPHFSESKLPALEISEGQFLFSSNVAAKYVYLNAGISINEDAENDLLDWENTCLLPTVGSYLVSVIGHGKKDKALSEAVTKVVKQLDSKLSKTSHLLGDSLSLCDVCIYSTLYPVTLLKNCDILDKFANVKKWLDLVSKHPQVQAVVSEVSQGKGHEIFKASLLTQSFPTVKNAKSQNNPSPSASKAPAASASTDQVAFETVDQDSLDAAKKAWKNDLSSFPSSKERVHPVLPKKGERNIMICSALPYVNNIPHLGNIIGCVLSADVFSRFCRLRNYNVIYICGTDEYGTATETKALQECTTPRAICDKYNQLHKEIYDWFNIDFDHFGRTSHPKHIEVAQEIFHKLQNNGYILKDSMEQLFCTNCSKFLADRLVEGTCPLCSFDDARGDQCDGCGKLINAIELIQPKCKVCKSNPVVKSTDHLFLDLSVLSEKLQKHLDSVYEAGKWTHNSKVVTKAWIRDGLKPRCISRDLKWGIPIPLDGYREKVFYVWYDAPIGYISSTACYTDKWRQWWKNPDQVELYHFLGKDNIPFHSVIFPSCLLGANDGYTLVNSLIATEYLNYEDTKFSKSRGTGVFGDQVVSTGIPADVYRFYLLYLRPESQDTSFSWDDLLLKNNSELLNNLGNFINRSLSFLSSNFDGTIQPMDDLTEQDLTLIALVTRELQAYVDNMEACRLRDSLRNILSISKLGNQYMQMNKPWVLAKGDATEKRRAGLVVSINCNISCLLSVLLQPYMPQSSATIQQQLAAPSNVNVVSETFVPRLQPGHKIGKPSPLFQKIETQTIQNLKEMFVGQQEVKPEKKKPAAGGDKPANPEEVARLTQAISDQGNKVRELKSQKAEKSVIDVEVKVLLQLKAELATAGGTADSKQQKQGDGGKKGKSGKGKEGSKDQPKKEKTSDASSNSAPSSNGAVSSPEVDRLTQAVADQGNKVRELKTSKADKPSIDAEVAKLLSLKRELAVAQGLDPDAASGGSKKKGKKK